MSDKTTVTMYPPNYSGGDGQTIEVPPGTVAEMLGKGWFDKDPLGGKTIEITKPASMGKSEDGIADKKKGKGAKE